MTTKGKLLSAASLVMVGGVALVVGVSLSTLLLVGISLLCPAAMYFGMHGSGGGDHSHERGQAEKSVVETSTKALDGKRAA